MITQAENGFLRSLEDVERELDRKGISKADWAREHGIKPGVLYEIFSRRSSCRRGEAHRAAVLLGLKEGVIEERVQP
ncbi:DNA-binding protein [Desulfovibrio piger]|uniref:DNA-binding protein n=1 Tax=Desulfovibrio piger TaxID=901 RepID=UPI002665005B|nr:DNA-binding protein [Desulfovibrio piger]